MLRRRLQPSWSASIVAWLGALAALCGLSRPSVSSAEPASCARLLSEVLTSLRYLHRAKNPSRRMLDEALHTLDAHVARCHSAAWYLSAARLTRTRLAVAQVKLGQRRYAGIKPLLADALARYPKDRELLGYVAYLAVVHPSQSPGLPAEACAAPAGPKVAARDTLQAYICGHAALRLMAYSQAVKEFTTISGNTDFVDAAVLRAQALWRAGKRAAAKAAARAAVDALVAARDAGVARFDTSSAERLALIAKAKALLYR